MRFSMDYWTLYNQVLAFTNKIGQLCMLSVEQAFCEKYYVFTVKGAQIQL